MMHRNRIKTVPVRLQYAILPYADFQVGTLGKQADFKIARFSLWRDTPENWGKFLGVSRPTEYLSSYVDRKGKPLPSMWIATADDKLNVAPERWQQLVAVLFYLAWARIPYMTADRALTNLFRNQAPTPADDLVGKSPDPELPEVLDQLVKWVEKLYEIRNSYTHGKTVLDYFLNRRSVWQDAFEVFRLSANRVILGRPERRPMDGSMLEKRLMSVRYFDEVVALLWDRGKWLPNGKKLGSGAITLDDAIRKGRALDPGLVETINSLSHLRQALFNICTFVRRTLEQLKEKECDSRNVEKMLEEFGEAYSSSSTPKLDPNAYIRKIAPRLTMWVPAIPIQGSNALLYELIDAFKNLLSVYADKTEPILNSLANTLP
jgi:hypothetical protein